MVVTDFGTISLAPPAPCRHRASSCAAAVLVPSIELVAHRPSLERLAPCIEDGVFIVSTPPSSWFLQSRQQGFSRYPRAYLACNYELSRSCSAAVREHLLHLHRAQALVETYIHAHTHRTCDRISPHPHRHRCAPCTPRLRTRDCTTLSIGIGHACQIAGCDAGRIASKLFIAASDTPWCHGGVWHDQSSGTEYT